MFWDIRVVLDFLLVFIAVVMLCFLLNFRTRKKIKTGKIDIKKISIKEGAIEFLVPKNKMKWNDNEKVVLFNIPVKNGSLFMLKDSDNYLKFFHVVIGGGRTDVGADVSNLSQDESHRIKAVWSLQNKNIALSVDDFLKSEQCFNHRHLSVR